MLVDSKRVQLNMIRIIIALFDCKTSIAGSEGTHFLQLLQYNWIEVQIELGEGAVMESKISE